MESNRNTIRMSSSGYSSQVKEEYECDKTVIKEEMYDTGDNSSQVKEECGCDGMTIKEEICDADYTSSALNEDTAVLPFAEGKKLKSEPLTTAYQESSIPISSYAMFDNITTCDHVKLEITDHNNEEILKDDMKEKPGTIIKPTQTSKFKTLLPEQNETYTSHGKNTFNFTLPNPSESRQDLRSQRGFHSKTQSTSQEYCTKEKVHRCDICLKSFSRQDSLAIHTKWMHNVVELRCEICKKSFDRKSYLNTHLRKIHKNKLFPCQVCEKVFTSSSQLNSHKKNHTKDKLLECDICKKSFSNKDNLALHVKMHTKIIKPLKCVFCKNVSTTFTTFTELNEHYRIHTMEEPYQCYICKKSFPTKYSLDLHFTRCV